MSKPSLIVQTVYFSAEDQSAAEELGFLLYEHLTRSRADRLAFGPGIPIRIAVKASVVDPAEAEQVVIIPVLGQDSAQDEGTRDQVFIALNDWDQLPGGTVSLLPVFLSEGWRAYEEDLPVKPLLQYLYDDEQNGFQYTLLELVISICRALPNPDPNAAEKPQDKLQIFISHSKQDLKATKEAAREIRDFAKTSVTARAFYDTTDLMSGEGLDQQLEVAAGGGVFVAVRSDTYASRTWCQRELLIAKRSRLPTLTVDVLRSGEARSYPYAGNGPTLVWSDRTNEEPHRGAMSVILRAMVEWLKARHFVAEVPRLAEGLPTLEILPRPPELLDLAQGPLLATRSSVVMHPDPQLSFAEQVVLKAARPRLQLLTPTTRYRAVTSNRDTKAKDRKAPLSFAALRDKQVALSISDVIDDSLKDAGLRPEHVQDVVVYVTRALIGAGASIAYGGNFRVGGFDQGFSDLISTYNAAGVVRAQYVYSYLPASFTRGKVPKNIGVNIRSLGWTPGFADQAKLKPPIGEVSLGRAALFLSDMRRVMVDHCFSRVVIGGQTLPRKEDGKTGYVGPYPGVVEEAWWTLRKGAPLYVLGGFGGAAALVASLVDSLEVPKALRASGFAWPEHARFQQVAREFATDPELAAVGAPATMDILVQDVRQMLAAHFETDETAVAWNGLTLAENKELLHSRDVARIADLIMRGQFKVIAAHAEHKLKIELVRGNVVQLEHADAVVLPTFRDLEISGAGAALDAAANGAVSDANRQRETLTQLNSSQVDANWLMIADLGVFSTLSAEDLPKRIEERANDVALLAQRHGFERLSLVTFAATVLSDTQVIAEHMVSGFASLAKWTSLQWFETQQERFDTLKACLGKRPDVELVVRELPETVLEPDLRRREDAVAVVRLVNGELRTTLLLPAGAAASNEHPKPLAEHAIEALNQANSPIAPPKDELAKMGAELSSWLFDGSTTYFDEHPETRLVVQHDVASSALPFESLRVGDRELGISGGIVRRPSMSKLELTNRAKRPPNTGQLQLLLIVNPTQNLANAEIEATEIRGALANDEVTIEVLAGADATKQAVLDRLANPKFDVAHYCGHAEFNPDAPESSGLVCANNERLTLGDFEGTKIGPRIVFFNACQSARVRGHEPQAVSRALAELVLRSGVEAFLGTFWPVADQAAGKFAASVYRELARGKQLDDAVLSARKLLHDEHRSDWANYALYGSGAFRLKVP